MTRDDIPEVGRIGVEAFNDLMARHKKKRPPLYPTLRWVLSRPRRTSRSIPERSLVATEDAGSSARCLSPRGDTVSVGPATVAPAAQGKGVGTKLFQAVSRALAEWPLDAHHAGFSEPRFLRVVVRIGYALGEEVAMFTLPAGFREEHDVEPAVRVARGEDLSEILTMDRRLFGSDGGATSSSFAALKDPRAAEGGSLQGYLGADADACRTMLGPAAPTRRSVAPTRPPRGRETLASFR